MRRWRGKENAGARLGNLHLNMAVKIIASCTGHCGLYNRAILGAHVFWGYGRLDFPGTPPTFYGNEAKYKRYLHRVVTITGTGTAFGGTRIDDIARLSGVLTRDDSGLTAGGDPDGDFFTFVSIDTDSTNGSGTVRTITGHDLTGNYTRTETLSSEYTESQMFADLDALVDSVGYLNAFGVDPEGRYLRYEPGTGDVVDSLFPDSSTEEVAITIAFYQHYAAENTAAYYDGTPSHDPLYSNLLGANAAFMQKFSSQVRMNYSVRLNRTNITRNDLLRWAPSDAESTWWADTDLPAANDVSCSASNTGACTKSTVDTDHPAEADLAGGTAAYKVLKKFSDCPQN